MGCQSSSVMVWWAASSIESIATPGPLLKLENASRVELHGIVREDVRGSLLQVTGGAHDRLVGVTLQNAGAQSLSHYADRTDDLLLAGSPFSDGTGNSLALTPAVLTTPGFAEIPVEQIGIR